MIEEGKIKGKIKSTFGKEVMKKTLIKGLLHKRFDLPINEILLCKMIEEGKIKSGDVAKLADALDLGSSG